MVISLHIRGVCRFGLFLKAISVKMVATQIAYRALPFREVDPMAYTELAEVIDRLSPPDDEG